MSGRSVEEIVERRLAAWTFLHAPVTLSQVEAKREELMRAVEREAGEEKAA